jgi:hypothetical protein
LLDGDEHEIEEEFGQRAVENLIVAEEVVEGAVVAVGEVAVDVGVVLEQEQVELDFGFGVGRFMHDAID